MDFKSKYEINKDVIFNFELDNADFRKFYELYTSIDLALAENNIKLLIQFRKLFSLIMPSDIINEILLKTDIIIATNEVVNYSKTKREYYFSISVQLPIVLNDIPDEYDTKKVVVLKDTLFCLEDMIKQGLTEYYAECYRNGNEFERKKLIKFCFEYFCDYIDRSKSRKLIKQMSNYKLIVIIGYILMALKIKLKVSGEICSLNANIYSNGEIEETLVELVNKLECYKLRAMK